MPVRRLYATTGVDVDLHVDVERSRREKWKKLNKCPHANREGNRVGCCGIVGPRVGTQTRPRLRNRIKGKRAAAVYYATDSFRNVLRLASTHTPVAYNSS